jgi:hypothetical protein
LLRNASWRALRPRRLLVYVLAGCAALALAFTWSASSGSAKAASSAIPAAAARQLDAIMLRAALLNGDVKPSWIEAVATTRAAALQEATPGDLVPGSAKQSAYLVVMKGTFTLRDAPVPPHSPLPTGHYLAMTFNPTTFQLMDLGLSNRAPRIALWKFGPVSDLASK